MTKQDEDLTIYRWELKHDHKSYFDKFIGESYYKSDFFDNLWLPSGTCRPVHSAQLEEAAQNAQTWYDMNLNQIVLAMYTSSIYHKVTCMQWWLLGR